MSVLSGIASAVGRRDQEPNIALAKTIAAQGDQAAVRQLVQGLSDRGAEVQSDCLKVLYELGYRRPEMIQGFAADFVRLLDSRNNRLVWGGMIALGTIAALRAGVIGQHLDTIMRATERGSVITQDWGIRVLAAVSAADRVAEARVAPFLTGFLQSCPPKDLPRHAESLLPAVNAQNRAGFLSILERRLPEMNATQAKRLGKVIRDLTGG